MSQFEIKAKYELELCRVTKTRHPRCQLCGINVLYLHLHHIINRGFLPKYQLDNLPMCFLSLLCADCHLYGKMGDVNTPEMRAKLLAINAKLFGLEVIEQGFLSLENMLYNGFNNEIVSFERVKEIYYE